MRRYLENSIVYDLIFCAILGIVIFFCRPFLIRCFTLPEVEPLLKFMDAMAKVATPLIGFLLTIVGIIVTFKNNYDGQKPATSDETNQTSDYATPPANTVFQKTIDKKKVMYGTDLHKRVMKVFLFGVYELTTVVFVFLAFESGFIKISRFWAALLTCLGFLIIFTAIVRSLFIYRQFLNAHIATDNPEKK
jgi:hypothetical protein